MQPCTQDWELLRRYAETGDEQAFAQLVAAHVDMVYSAALRQVRDRHLAEEVVQIVFTVLARKIGSIRPDTVLPAWLHKTTRYTALNVLKVQARRRSHERKAAEEMAAQAMTRVDSSWNRLSPELDKGIARLNERDRSVIMLRFFQRKSLAETGAALGISEEAAAMRVSRAVAKLRAYFGDRGMTLTGASLGGIILANSVHAAPHGFGQAVAANVMQVLAGTSAGAAAVSAAADAVIRAMLIAKAKFTAMVVGAVLAAALALGVFTNYLLSPLLNRAPIPRPEQHAMLQNEPLKRMRTVFLERRAMLFVYGSSIR